MSYTTLATAREDGILRSIRPTFRNSHGSAPFVWSALALRYRINVETWYNGGQPSMFSWEKVWEYEKQGGALEPWEKNTLFATYDNVVIKRDDIPLTSKSLRLFEEYHSRAMPNHVCSLIQQADVIDEHYSRDELVKYLAWAQTSLSDTWYLSYDAEKEEEIEYCILTGTKHWVATLTPLEI
jgi:hypothetical protein